MIEENPIPPIPPSIPPAPIASAPIASVGGDLALSEDIKSLAAIPHFLNVIFLVPLLVYLLKKDTHPFIKQQSAEALNFSLTCLLVHLVCSFLAVPLFCIPSLLSAAVFVLQIVLGIMGGLKVKQGLPYKYFASIPMVT